MSMSPSLRVKKCFWGGVVRLTCLWIVSCISPSSLKRTSFPQTFSVSTQRISFNTPTLSNNPPTTPKSPFFSRTPLTAVSNLVKLSYALSTSPETKFFSVSEDNTNSVCNPFNNTSITVVVFLVVINPSNPSSPELHTRLQFFPHVSPTFPGVGRGGLPSWCCPVAS